MRDFNLTDRAHKEISFRELVSTGTSIVSNTVDVLSELPYLQYLEGLGHRVIVVDSKNRELLHAMADTHDLRIETYTDPAHNLIKRFKEQWDLSPDHHALTRILRFQILYVDGEEVGTWQQPVTEQWKDFLSNRTAVKSFIRRFGAYGTKWLNEQDKNDNLPWTSYGSSAYGHRASGIDARFEQFLRYYKLMPNKQLTEVLKELG
jgi:hypothetical protein